MARDNHIIRPDRLTQQTRPIRQELTRQERIQLLVSQILPDVRATLDSQKPTPKRAPKR